MGKSFKLYNCIILYFPSRGKCCRGDREGCTNVHENLSPRQCCVVLRACAALPQSDLATHRPSQKQTSNVDCRHDVAVPHAMPVLLTVMIAHIVLGNFLCFKMAKAPSLATSDLIASSLCAQVLASRRALSVSLGLARSGHETIAASLGWMD